MILRLSSNAQRAVLVAASFAVALILSYFSIRNALATHYAGLQTAEAYERAAHLETQALERRLAVFLTLLEPAMILVMGGIVLLIVLAILLPIIEINQLVH